MKRALKQINEAFLAGFVEIQIAAMDRVERFADSGNARRSGVSLGAGLGAVAVSTGTAFAAKEGCDNDAAKSLLNFISSLANFMIGLGAGLALLMLAVGAVLIIAGGTPERVSKGMKMLKNVVIGLGVLGAGAFIKFLITTFVEGAQKGTGDSGVKTPKCLDKGTL